MVKPLRHEWEITAVFEIQDILYRLVGGEFVTIKELRDRLHYSQRTWEDIAQRCSVELSGLDFPVAPDNQKLSNGDTPR